MLGRPSNKQRRAIFDAVSSGDPTAVRALLDAAPELVKVRMNKVKWGDKRDAIKSKWDATPLHWAALYGFRRVAEVLIASGAAVDVRDNDGQTPLHHLGWIGFDEKPEDDGPRYVAEVLLAHGANIGAKDKSGSTPLHTAARDPFWLKTVEVLLAHGANAKARDKDGFTPIHQAVLFGGNGNPKGVKGILAALIAAGADVNARNAAGETSLFWVESKARRAQEASYQEGAEEALAVAQFLRDNGARE